ncbi:hypothetical protein BC937DRAFT_89776 [Endogone sp. FLAS-F59071]|nr:hypothetical protein BC937DRAFT_89776 [Endogone sp. FLAS-F59071]|eukprot:RUS17584.1 hypothetical protein BC937DRAFT_89776 [Endogone sp. FLAS-F59071]
MRRVEFVIRKRERSFSFTACFLFFIHLFAYSYPMCIHSPPFSLPLHMTDRRIGNITMGNCCGVEKKSNGYTLTERSTDGPPRGPKSETPEDREARLEAAEQRRQQAEARGVQKGGGKLSKQLAEQRNQTHVEEAVSNDNLVWRTD